MVFGQLLSLAHNHTTKATHLTLWTDLERVSCDTNKSLEHLLSSKFQETGADRNKLQFSISWLARQPHSSSIKNLSNTSTQHNYVPAKFPITKALLKAYWLNLSTLVTSRLLLVHCVLHPANSLHVVIGPKTPSL